MGVLLSRFRRKQTTYEILEGIDKDINRLQKNRKVNQDRQKHFVTSLLIYSIGVYVIAAVIFFCVYFPDTWQKRLLYSLPLLIFPILIWGIKKLLHWYFVKRISSHDLALQQLRERKKQILEDVMETETYKRAREILEKFDPTRLRKLEISSPEAGRSHVTAASTPGTVVQQRTVRTTQHIRGVTSVPSRLPAPASPSQSPAFVRPKQPLTSFTPTPPAPQAQVRATSQISTPVMSQIRTPGMSQIRTPVMSQIRAPVMSQIRTPVPSQMMTPVSSLVRTPFPAQPIIRGGFSAAPAGLPMPRSVLPRERGTMDRLMDYLVGDGPENRFALICQSCSSHNGMALKEEFEYLSFRCCYCYTVNPAKKQRPLAPRLEFFAPPGNRKGRATAVAPSNEESDDDDVDDEDDYSDHDSLESDTSTGGSSNKPVISPAASTSASSSTSLPSNSSKALETSKPKEADPLNAHEASGSDPRETQRSNSSPRVRPNQTEGQTPKITASQAPTTTGIPMPKTQPGQSSKLPVGSVTKSNGRESSAELKDDISQANKTALNEKSNLPRTVPVKIVSEISRDIPEAKNRIPVPTASLGTLPAVSVNSTSAEGRSRIRSTDALSSQTKATSGSELDSHSPGGASVDS